MNRCVLVTKRHTSDIKLVKFIQLIARWQLMFAFTVFPPLRRLATLVAVKSGMLLFQKHP